MGAIADLFTIMWQAPHLAQSKYRIKSKVMNQSTRFLLICLINPTVFVLNCLHNSFFSKNCVRKYMKSTKAELVKTERRMVVLSDWMLGKLGRCLMA